MAQYKGSSRKHEVKASRRRKDTRLIGQKISDFFDSGEGTVLGLFILPILSILLIKVPFAGEAILLLTWAFGRKYIRTNNRSFDFPYRVPMLAKVRDGSIRGGKELGSGITLLGNDLETKEQIYASNSDLRTHILVLGTTGSGKTEFLLGIVFNALIQNTGFIYVDGKGDPKLQNEIFRLARFLGREDDLLIINFITSGRDFVDKQPDKVTNNMNLMGNTSSGMLIELIVSLMDDSGSGSGDMWKGRAISFVAALTRPLIYLRDKGYINLSPEKYLEYFELNVIEELVWDHNGRYGEMFNVIIAPLRSYLVTLPGYQKTKMKKQETKTLEQHGYIVMQLTRIFNDLTFNYGHIFKTKVGDVDFFDVVINRRLLVVLLPALERAPDSMRMLGKMIVGSIKQMMAGCLGNRVEGVVREIIESRPTNAAFPFYAILDEYGYYAVIGFAVAPAQARSLGFSIIFAAQDFSSLKKSSAEEADATWENTNIRAIGKLTSGQRSETWERIQGASGEGEEARLTGFERRSGAVDEAFRQQDNVTIERRARLDYDDLAMQQDGEFTFLIGKKEKEGRSGGVRVIRGMGFYTAGKRVREMRINDLLPIEVPDPSDLPQNRKAVESLMQGIVDGSFTKAVLGAIKGDPILASMNTAFARNHADPERPKLGRFDASLAVLGYYLFGSQISPKNDAVDTAMHIEHEETTPASDSLDMQQKAVERALLDVADIVLNQPKCESAYASPVITDDNEEIVINTEPMTTNITMTDADNDAFREQALPILRQHLFMLDGVPPEEEWKDELSVADREQLLQMEVLASGKAFASLEDKWETEDSINSMREEIARETTYILPPTPELIGIDEAKGKLDLLSEACQKLMKRSLRK